MTNPAAAIRFPHAERVGLSAAQIIPTFQGAVVIAHALIPEDTGPTLLARFVDESFTPLLEAAIFDVTVTVFDDADGSTDWIFQDAVATADVWFDTLQVDARWREDSEGYNFRYAYTDESVRLEGGRRYRFEVTLNRTDLPPISQVYSIETLPLMSRRT